MKALAIIAVLVIGFFWFVASSYQASLRADNAPSMDTVTLQAAPGNTEVQMFGYIPGGYVSDAANAKTTLFPDGTKCAVEFGPKRFVIEGVGIEYYYLNCNHIYGHVNAKWVRD